MLQDLLGDRATAKVIFDYLFKKINKYEYRSQIGDRAKAKALWSKVEDNGYILKNCKLFAYAVHVNRSLGFATSPAKFGIHKADVALLRSLDLTHLAKGYKSYSVFDFDNLESSIVLSPHLKAHIGKFISKKMTFLIRSYGVSRTNIEIQLVCAAMFALRKAYPVFENDLHALNICKTAIHNCGIGIIQFWTREKRNALLNENNEYQAVHVNYDVLRNVGVGPVHDNEHHVNMRSLESLSKGLSVGEQAYIKAASGDYDAGFSLFAGKDNRDLVERMDYSRYLALLSGYHGLSAERQTALLLGLRKSLT